MSESAISLAVQLNQVLSLEFDALKGQDLDRFEALQTSKNAILADLTLLCPDTEDLQKLPEWDQLREELLACRDAHRRNGPRARARAHARAHVCVSERASECVEVS